MIDSDLLGWLESVGWPVIRSNRAPDSDVPDQFIGVIVLDTGTPQGGEGWFRTGRIQFEIRATDDKAARQMADAVEKRVLTGPWPQCDPAWSTNIVVFADGVPGWGELPPDNANRIGYRAQFDVHDLANPLATQL